MAGIIAVVASILVAAVMPFDLLPSPLDVAFHEGGWGMRLILFAFFVSTWLFVDRTIYLAKATTEVRAFFREIEGYLQRGDVAGAANFAEANNRPISRIVAAGLRRADQGEKAVREGMDLSAYHELPELEKRTGYLALMGNVATLMGLFGTIVGLIKSFAGVAGRETGEKATLLAAGISEAMNCTAFGLLTGIGALFAFSVLNGRTQTLIDEIHYFTHKIYRSWKRGAGLTAPAAEVPDTSATKPVSTPHSKLLAHIGLERAGGGHGGGRKSTFASLQLTPLIDMFIVLVIFLLMSFSATGDIITLSEDLKLPFASNVEDLKRVPVVAVSHPTGTDGYITLEGAEVATAQELLDDINPDWKIAKLTEQLEISKNNWKVTHPNEEFQGELIIQADENVDFAVLKKVMYSAGIAGYGNLLFAVVERASGAAE